ncbi:c-type cytochrome [Diaphorobacter caeni]|uniref:c-type cytochrome n=1 Tax=Diaphorobacter caeni TaxID=2784387 RepID=UPI00189059A4|nr:c-type cytochrome [Diaphorobacter caeni]MBF5007687.1 c-type cytochrome [Diaphorobacter caeni]
MPPTSSLTARHHAMGLALLLALALALPLRSHAATETRLRAQDVALIAASCANCHGPDGRSVGEIPSLRGATSAHLQQRMRDFKSGKAADATVMTRLMKGYADDEIDALAQWFADPATSTASTATSATTATRKEAQ